MDKSMIVTGAHAAVKRERARAMRREMTPAEDALWQRLRTGRLGGFHFRRQQVVDGFIADFYCHATGLVVEVDGGVHLDQAGYDAARDAAIASRGLRVLRFTNGQISHQMGEVLAAILDACGAAETP